ncbi:hypothetical protein MHYP_G00053180 [Metynnis hypsauchen]
MECSLAHPGKQPGCFTYTARLTCSPRCRSGLSRPSKHHVSGNRMVPPFPEGLQMAMFGMGCFWGAEWKFWRQKGVYSTQVGYSGGYTPNPTYEEVCTGKTGHAEVVRVVFEPGKISYAHLLKVFWESHNPTQGMRQGNDVGTTYRSAIYAFTQEQLSQALASKEEYQKAGQQQSEVVPRDGERGVEQIPKELGWGRKHMGAICSFMAGWLQLTKAPSELPSAAQSNGCIIAYSTQI